jgi:UDP-3-O-[3-hydroxymyristoyl] N-acetylglucosamine deacetylase
MGTREKAVLKYQGLGVTSRKEVSVEVSMSEPGSGIVFEVLDNRGFYVRVPAVTDSVVNTLRNVVLGTENARLCIVEHFLAAAALWGLTDLCVKVDGPEMPLGDGSAQFWMELFQSHEIPRSVPEATIELKQSVMCPKGDRMLVALPDEKFSVTYLMDWNHPQIGKRWQTFSSDMSPMEIASARTFGWKHEHDLLGIGDEVVSMTGDGFTHELRFEDEPIRHKLLDLIGDLSLSGVNPMAIKARFVSIKAGHELDVEMARKLRRAIGVE